MKFAYADPPYIGQAKRHYGKESSYAGEVDHIDLIGRLQTGGFDGWALSCSSPSLRYLLPLCPPDVRIGAWVKPFAIFKPGVNPAYAWEPVIFKPGRSGKARRLGRKAPTIRDWISVNITLKKGLVGAKPPQFCAWLFDLLGMEPADEFYDLYPGTGGVTLAWEAFKLEGERTRNP